MIKLFKQDAARWMKPQEVTDPSQLTFSKMVRLFWKYLPVQAMFWFRLGSWFKQKGIPGFPGIIQRFIYQAFGLELVIGQDIDGGLYIAHPVGTVISVHKLGKNCTVIANVTIGMRNEWAFPVIGDNVFIGAGARILGEIKVGDGAVIGANAVVIEDVPAGATVVGIPAKVIKINGKRVGDDQPEEQVSEIIV